MLREMKTFECFSADDIYDTVEYANNRTDGGKTIIKLNRHDAPYLMNRPIVFKDTVLPVIFDADDLVMGELSSDGNFKIFKEGE